MIIWALAFVLLGCLGVAGWSFGAIRAAFAFVGILAGLLSAKWWGHTLEHPLASVGLKNPVLPWLLAPLILFVLVLIVFKIVGLVVHRKVELYYKYKAGDLRNSLWKRLNVRLGICVGLLNGAVYLVLICMVIHVVSQVTIQVTADNAGWMMKLSNAAGKHLESTGMSKVAAAVDPMPSTFYQAADLAGLLYHNVLLEARVLRYPGFLSLCEKDVFQQIANDGAFTEWLQHQPPIGEILNHARIQPIAGDPAMLQQIWSVAMPNIKDLEKFLRTGISDKYDPEKLVGRWEVNLNASLYAVRESRTNISSADMRRVRAIMSVIFEKTTLLITPEPEKQAILKNVGRLSATALAPGGGAGQRPGAPPGARGPGRGAPPRGGQPPAGGPPANAPLVAEGYDNFPGTWSGGGSTYQLRFGNRGTFTAVVDGDKLAITGYSYPMVFDRMY